jgi:hypothetical protein
MLVIDPARGTIGSLPQCGEYDKVVLGLVGDAPPKYDRMITARCFGRGGKTDGDGLQFWRIMKIMNNIGDSILAGIHFIFVSVFVFVFAWDYEGGKVIRGRTGLRLLWILVAQPSPSSLSNEIQGSNTNVNLGSRSLRDRVM